MFTGTTSHAGALVTAVLALTGTAILRGGAAAADPNQDDQFLALLDSAGIPALEGVPSLIDTAHKVCRAIDAGSSAEAVVDAMVRYAYSQDPPERLYAPGRLARTEAKFVTAAVGAYCPYDRGKVASITANPASNWKEPTHRGAVHTAGAVTSAGAAPGSRSGAVPTGDIFQPNPPALPTPPPVADLRTPPQPIATPPRPRQLAPRPQQPAPRPQQPAPPPQQPAPPPELAPPLPPELPPPPPPAPPMPPGFVRLAP